MAWLLAVIRFFLAVLDLEPEPTAFEGLDGFCVPVPVEVRDCDCFDDREDFEVLTTVLAFFLTVVFLTFFAWLTADAAVADFKPTAFFFPPVAALPPDDLGRVFPTWVEIGVFFRDATFFFLPTA